MLKCEDFKCGMCENTNICRGWQRQFGDGPDYVVGEITCPNTASSFEEQLEYVRETLKAFIHCANGCECTGCEADRDHVEDLIAHLVDLGKEEAVDAERDRGWL